MTINLLYETSQLPAVAKKYLKAIVESKEELIYFLEQIKPKHKNLMKAIAEQRFIKLQKRNYTLEDFIYDYEQDCVMAIQILFLYPYSDSVERYTIKQLEDKTFSLTQLYDFHKKHLNFNPVLTGKMLIQQIQFP